MPKEKILTLAVTLLVCFLVAGPSSCGKRGGGGGGGHQDHGGSQDHGGHGDHGDHQDHGGGHNNHGDHSDHEGHQGHTDHGQKPDEHSGHGGQPENHGGQPDHSGSHGQNGQTKGKQRTCPVTGEALGSMGTPIPVTVKGETILVCCQGCVDKVKKDPDKYLQKVHAEIGEHGSEGHEQRGDPSSHGSPIGNKTTPSPQSRPPSTTPDSHSGHHEQAAIKGPATGRTESGGTGATKDGEERVSLLREVQSFANEARAADKSSTAEFIDLAKNRTDAELKKFAEMLKAIKQKTKQRVCPVTGQILGSMGEPISVTVKGQTIFVCCEGCKETVKDSPDEYLKKVQAEIEASSHVSSGTPHGPSGDTHPETEHH